MIKILPNAGKYKSESPTAAACRRIFGRAGRVKDHRCVLSGEIRVQSGYADVPAQVIPTDAGAIGYRADDSAFSQAFEIDHRSLRRAVGLEKGRQTHNQYGKTAQQDKEDSTHFTFSSLATILWADKYFLLLRICNARRLLPSLLGLLEFYPRRISWYVETRVSRLIG